VPEEKSSSNLYLIERREAQRVHVHLPVEVTTIDGDGCPIKERTYIEDVSDFGCRFTTHGPIKQGDTVGVKILGRYGNNLPDEESRLYEIMWVAPSDQRFTVGARVLQGEKLASAKFPVAFATEKQDPK
jgi:PilZ domain-containing protein